MLTADQITKLNDQSPTDREVGLGTILAAAATQEVKGGVAAASTITLAQAAKSIDSMLAFTTATGAAAAKALLAVTTDYTLSADGKTLTIVTDQSANTLVITYRLG